MRRAEERSIVEAIDFMKGSNASRRGWCIKTDWSWAYRMDNLSQHEDVFASASHEDFVLRTPWPVLSLTISYLYFVLVFGPSFMKTKRPMTLKRTILVYNSVQVAFSFWWFYESLNVISSLGWRESFNLAGGCAATKPHVHKKINMMGYWYLISKLVELLDTIFFVLRGKQSQVTFLHVYHHTNMAISTWFFIKYNQGPQSMIIGACNTFVHVIMYSYYLLAALGPNVRRHLWWKRYITALQITQFLVILSYLVSLCLFGCRVGTAFVTFSAINTCSFLALFIHFYVQAYRNRNRTVANKATDNGTVENIPRNEAPKSEDQAFSEERKCVKVD